MAEERWFPARHQLPDGPRLSRLLCSGPEWQIYRLDTGNLILVARQSLADRWVGSRLLTHAILGSVAFGDVEYKTIVSGVDQRLEPVAECRAPDAKVEGLAFAQSLNATRKIDEVVPLHDAIYVERYSRLLPTWTVSEGLTDAEILGRWLTGGVVIPATSLRRLSSLLGWLGRQDVADLVEEAGFNTRQDSSLSETTRTPGGRSLQASDVKDISYQPASDKGSRPEVSPGQFRLPGREVLEAFFNEHVIDIIVNQEHYKLLGIEFPSSIVLHGPPGCGKTFAVERLVEHLDWPIFHIDSSSVGSPYIHETSRKVGEIFDKAMDASPSLIVIDEMESFLSNRQNQGSTNLHHVEEIAEFLRRIPEASRCHVLVIGMTNQLEMIDPAILRHGRFDHIVEVGMPSSTEVGELVKSLLAKLPIDGDIELEELIEPLTGKALSEVAFVVREASRLAVRAGKNALDTNSLRQALARHSLVEPKKRSIGFVWD